MTTPNDSRDFYPTPDNLAWEMAYSLQSTKYGWKHLPQPILEPSAGCLLYTSPSPREYAASRMPSSA